MPHQPTEIKKVRKKEEKGDRKNLNGIKSWGKHETIKWRCGACIVRYRR